MKPTQIILIFLGVLCVTLVLTNPNLDAHKKAVLAKMEEKMGESDTNNSTNKWEEVGRNIGMSLAQNIIDKAVERDNFLFFSLTKIRFGDKSEQIGFGVFDKVWINNEYPNKTAGFSDWDETTSNIDTTASTTPTTVSPTEYQVEQYPDYNTEDESTTAPSGGGFGYYYAKGTTTDRIYFHDAPDISTRRQAYIITQETVYVQKIENNFGYVEFTNTQGQTTSGWIEMQYLANADE